MLSLWYILNTFNHKTWDKGAGCFHSASQSKEGNLVLAFPSIRFSWNQIISGTKYEYKTSFGPIACHSWQGNGKKRPSFHGILTFFVTFFIDCGHIYVPKGTFWGTSRPHIGELVMSLFTLGSTLHDWEWPKNVNAWMSSETNSSSFCLLIFLPFCLFVFLS